MSPRIHDRHALVDPDGATEDELAEALLEAHREVSQPIPLHQPPAGFLDRIMKRTLQVLEVLVAMLLLKFLWTRKAFAAGLAGTVAVTGVGVLTLDDGLVDAELPRVDGSRIDEQGNASQLLARLAMLNQSDAGDGEHLKVIIDPPPAELGAPTPLGRIGLVDTRDHDIDELTLSGRNKRDNAGVYWLDRDVDRIIARAMRKYGMSLRGKPVDGGWRCHEGTVSHGGQLAYKYYYDGTSGRTKTVPVRCFRL